MAVLGYARVSTTHQSVDMQVQALKAAGAERIWAEHCRAVVMIAPSWPRF